MLCLALPDGSLSGPVRDIFERSGVFFRGKNGNRSYELVSNRPKLFGRVFQMRPQESPVFVVKGLFDLAITGQDWVAENQVQDQVVEVMSLPISRSGSERVQIVLAVGEDSLITCREDINDSHVVYTEYPNITKNWFKGFGTSPTIEKSVGCTEGKLLFPEPVADAIVELTDSGGSFTDNKVRGVDEVFVSMTCLVASQGAWQDKNKRPLIEEVANLLESSIESLRSASR